MMTNADLLIRNEIDEVCDEFERTWKASGDASIEQCLESFSSQDPKHVAALLIELLQVDMECRRQAGQQPELREYLRRFQSFEKFLAAEFERLFTAAGKPAPDPPTSELPEKFIVLEEIGTGSFGRVFKAQDRNLGRLVAIKLPRAVPTEDDNRRFRREARIAAQLKHPNIVPVHEIGEWSGRVYIVSEYIDGQDLASHMEAGPVDSTVAATICMKLARALHAAHEQDIVHRDLKPGNVILDKLLEPHLTDFGLARIFSAASSVSLEGALVGTPNYMSPEQVRHAGQVDGRTDIYSLGVILYEMLTGVKPLDGDLRTLLSRIATEEPRAPRELVESIPEDLEVICLTALAKDPADRYATAKLFAEELQKYLAGQSVVRPKPIVRKRRISRRSWMAAALGSAAAGTMGYRFLRDEPLFPQQRLPVRVTTDPEEATVVCYPLSPYDGSPMVEYAERIEKDEPKTVELFPGDYLVVADIPGYGFHEVFRRVPYAGAQKEIFPHDKWDFEKGTIVWEPIKLWKQETVLDGMAAIPKVERCPIGTSYRSDRPSQFRSIPAFYLDPTEVSVAAFRQRFDGQPPMGMRTLVNTIPDDRASCYVSYDEALCYAELIGKRLPDEFEFESAATRGGTTRYPWGNERFLPRPWEFERVGSPESDKLEGSVPVYGLFSNVAEWTTSWAERYRFYFFKTKANPDQRIARGMPSSAVPASNQMNGHESGVRSRLVLDRRSFNTHWIGFRCARSRSARLLASDFNRLA